MNRSNPAGKNPSPFSRFYTNGSDRAESRNGQSINAKSSVVKKSADVLFREHRDAAIAWAAQKQDGSVPVVAENSSILGDAASAPNVLPVQHLPTMVNPLSTERYSQTSMLAANGLGKPLPSFEKLATETGLNSERLNVQTESAEMQAKEGPFSAEKPLQTSPLPTKQAEIQSPKDFVFTKFMKDTEQPALVEGATGTYIPKKVHLNLRSFLYERLQDITGVSLLAKHERTLLFLLLVVSPLLVYLLEKLVASAFTVSVVELEQTTITPWFLYRSFLKMNYLDLAASTALALSLSFAFDYDIRATDRFIGRCLWNWRTRMYAVRDKVLGTMGFNAKDFRGEVEPTGAFKEERKSTNFVKVSVARVSSTLDAITRVPVFLRFTITVLSIGALFRVVVGHIVEAVRLFVVQYADIFVIVASCILIMCIAYVVVRYSMRRRASRVRAVKVITSVVKSLLTRRGRAYPVLYLFEEVSEIVEASANGTSRPQMYSPVSKPAVVLSPEQVKSFLGADRSSVPPGGDYSRGEVPPLFGAPNNLSTTYKQHFLQSAMSQAHAVNGTGAEESEDAAAYVEPRPEPRKLTDAMEGYTLTYLWKDVERMMESDSRIQRVDLIMDGKKQSCWRLLQGSTQACI